MKKLEDSQKKIFDKIKNKIILNKNTSELNIFRYLSNSNKFSFAQMQFILNKKNLISYFFFNLKNFFSFFFFYDYKVYKSKIKNKYKRVIISWGKFEDFDKNGTFFDRYIGENSNSKSKNLWVIQYDGKSLPKKLDKNIFILKKSEKKTLYLKYLLRILKESKLTNLFENFSYNSLYAFVFDDLITTNLKKLNFKEIIIPYEGQIFQKYLIRKLKKKNLKITGLVHTFPQPIPFNLFFDKYSCPNKLTVNSKSLKNCLIKNMQWKKKDVLIKKSKRFDRNSKFDMKKKIFFPYEIPNQNKLLMVFKEFVDLYKNKINFDFDVKIHPVKFEDLSHKNLKEKIIKIINQNNFKKSKNSQNISIFFEYTSSLIEALERDVKVFQLCTEPILQVYTSKFFDGIRTIPITNNIIEYKKIKKNTLIKM